MSLMVSVDVKHHVYLLTMDVNHHERRCHRIAIGIYNLLLPPSSPHLRPSLISRTVSVDVKHHVYFARLLRFMWTQNTMEEEEDVEAVTEVSFDARPTKQAVTSVHWDCRGHATKM